MSDLELYDACGRSYRLRCLLGFQPTLAPELGYGRAVHHVLRHVAEHVRDTGQLPTKSELDRIFDHEFYLPVANKAAHRELKANGRKLVNRYVDGMPRNSRSCGRSSGRSSCAHPMRWWQDAPT